MCIDRRLIMTKDKKCCKTVDAQLECKATADLNEEIDADLECEDGSLAELLAEDELKDEEK
jgi:hypothetical protein